MQSPEILHFPSFISPLRAFLLSSNICTRVSWHIRTRPWPHRVNYKKSKDRTTRERKQLSESSFSRLDIRDERFSLNIQQSLLSTQGSISLTSVVHFRSRHITSLSTRCTTTRAIVEPTHGKSIRAHEETTEEIVGN